MKTSPLLLILLSINLVACLGDEAPETPETPETPENPENPENPVYDGAIGSAIEDCDEQLGSYSTFQQVYNDCIVWDGNNGKLVIKYRSDDDTVTGLGLSIHYSSDQLDNLVTNDRLEQDLIAYDDGIMDNSDNDGDSSTDMVISYGWTSLNGNWPGQEEVNLVTLEFTKESDAQIDYIINYTSSSNAAGYELILGK